MTIAWDVIIVGSGPAGVMGAAALVDAGCHVLMLEAGETQRNPELIGDLEQVRLHDSSAWRTFIGDSFEYLSDDLPSSPKFRVPANQHYLSGYKEKYKVQGQNFSVVGSLAPGGLSNLWGAGVACFDDQDLRRYPIAYAELKESYKRVARRIGVSGSSEDNLGRFFGQEIMLQPVPKIGVTSGRLLTRYQSRREVAEKAGITIGRARNAVLTQPLADRLACDNRGTCIWGCRNRAIYNAAFELVRLKREPSFSFVDGAFVERVSAFEDHAEVLARHVRRQESETFVGRTVMLACGTIGTTKLVLSALHYHKEGVPLLTNPCAGFGFWMVARTGSPEPLHGFGLAELSLRVSLDGDGYAFANLFSAGGLLATELLSRMPLIRPVAIKLLKILKPAILVGNCFLPGELSMNTLYVEEDGSIKIIGKMREDANEVMREVGKRISRLFRKYGLIPLPGSFVLAGPGEDVHYAGTVPMKRDPLPHQSKPTGEVAGLRNVFVVDGAALTGLPAKPPTFTIMANAERIARHVAERVCAENKRINPVPRV